MSFVSNLFLAFAQVAAEDGERVALQYPDKGRVVSYGELFSLTESIARTLWHSGLRPGQVAAIFHDKSPAAFATMLACLRLGIIYTNLDPTSPWERVRKILQNCGPSIIVNSFEELPFPEELEAVGHTKILQLTDLPDENVEAALPSVTAVCGSAPAYIMFTSGSTGTPKGAVMSHANVLWFIQWARDRFKITHADVLTNVNPIYFDNSVFDFYCAIFCGATLVPLVPEVVKNGRLLLQLVDKAHCTIWFSVPSLLVYLLTTRALTGGHFASLRKIIFGGEGFPKARLRELHELFGARADLENVYGPTECTCICSAKTIEPSDFDDMQSLAALGPLSQSFEFVILPQDPANPNFGELFLRGPQVGLGYYNDSARTNTAFTQSPVHKLYTDVGYRTGDLVLLDSSNGHLHFKGRADFQIKHMGYRIELEEIEAALNTMVGVSECAVIYQRLDSGLGQIVAFVGCPESIAPAQVIEHIARILPPYMVPKKVVSRRVLPKNANGKIDRVTLLDC